MQILNSLIWLVQLLLKVLRSHFTAGRFSSSHATPALQLKLKTFSSLQLGGDPPVYTVRTHISIMAEQNPLPMHQKWDHLVKKRPFFCYE